MRQLYFKYAILALFMASGCTPSDSAEKGEMFTGKMAKELAQSISSGDEKRTEKLISEGAEVNAIDQKGRTLLWLAMASNNLDEFKILIKNGADPTIPSSSGETVIHTAARLDTTNYLKELIEHGAPVDIENKGGATPLFNAVGNPAKNFELLIDNGANINHQDIVGDTPLFFAAAADDYDRIMKLLQLGANPKQKNKRGTTFQAPLATGPKEDSYTEESQEKREKIRQWLKSQDIQVEF
ncbi:MAG: hypothetical protein CMN25_02930 [Salinicola sp.]|uniref:ankyrin repeat domain-containing protein n=1 Tax=uncultured Salinicola sp. TaxID=1193542 RepID=UPI000C9098DD|nr:ankyrin repeat domain-containing protein [uncultured Salinicola sp.]MAM56270.1 hypothetical protein [Salinicola sp.]|tara:strand:- start:125 stop:844 length:720 start_codon:yes stop_codon:yes gene_type:complete